MSETPTPVDVVDRARKIIADLDPYLPWDVDDAGGDGTYAVYAATTLHARAPRREVAEFIVESRTLIPELLEEVRHWRSAVETPDAYRDEGWRVAGSRQKLIDRLRAELGAACFEITRLTSRSKITTPDSLEALPPETVIRDADGQVLERSGENGEWLQPGASTLYPVLPAQVLWTPEGTR